MLLGSLVGAVVGGVLADRLVCRRLLIITAVVFGLGAIGAALATGTTWLIAARIVAGIAQRLLRVAGHANRKTALVFYGARRLARTDDPGLWDEWRDRASGETLKSCTMIITEPNEFVAEVHDRMPILLVEKDFEPWLSGSAGLELLKPAPNDLLQRWPVSKRVNSSRAPADDATLIDPVEL